MVREVFDCVRQNVPDQQKVIQAFRSTHRLYLYMQWCCCFSRLQICRGTPFNLFVSRLFASRTVLLYAAHALWCTLFRACRALDRSWQPLKFAGSLTSRNCACPEQTTQL